MATMTVGTDLGNRLLMAALMAFHRPGIHVVGQRDITVWALQNLPTVPAHHKRGKAPPVEHQDTLLPPGQALVQFVQEGGRKVALPALLDLGPHVNDLDRWEGLLVDPVR